MMSRESTTLKVTSQKRIKVYAKILSLFGSFIIFIILAYKEDSVNLKGYFCWSLLDNFEWNAGYTERFGLYYVDFEDEKRQRTPKTSAQVYKTIVKNNAVVYKSL